MVQAYRDATINEFDDLIASLAKLRKEVSGRPTIQIGTRGIRPILSELQLESFYTVRTRCLDLLQSIPSQDSRFRDAIEFVRDLEPKYWRIDDLAEKLRNLKSDYLAGLISPWSKVDDSKEGKELLIRNSIYELKVNGGGNFRSSYDLMKKRASLAVKLAFGEESNQYRTFTEMVNRNILMGTSSAESDEEIERRYEKAVRNQRDQIVNSLKVMIDELRYLSVTSDQAPKFEIQLRQQIESARAKIETYENMFWFGISLLAGAMMFMALRSIDIYSHPNKLALDFALAGLTGIVVASLSRPKWRKASIFFGVFAVFVGFAALLIGAT